MDAPRDFEEGEPLPSAAKPPRKPRPSEIAAKKTKAAKAKKPKKKTPTKSKPKPKAKKPVKKPAKRKSPAKTKSKAKRKPVKARGPERLERLDMRLSKTEKTKLRGISKRKGIPITEVVWGAIAKLK